MSGLARRLAAAQAIIQPPQPFTVPLGEYTSTTDVPPFGNLDATIIRNCLPTYNGYKELKALQSVSDALGARVRGAFAAQDSSANVRIFACDATALYSLSSTSFTDVTGTALDLGTAVNGAFTQYGDNVLFTYYSTGAVEMQTNTITGANFSNLATSTRKPRGAYIAALGSFVVLGRTYDTVDTDQPQRVWWSALGDQADYDPDTATQSGFQDLEAADGWITGVHAGKEFALIFQEKAITRMTYVGGDLIFRFDKMTFNRGCIAPASIVGLGRLCFFRDTDGFYVTDGVNTTPIGKGKIDRAFLDEVDDDNKDRMSAAIDAVNALYVFSYPTKTSNGTPDKMLFYHWPSGKWTDAEVDHEFVFTDRTKGYSLEDIDTISTSLDTLTESLDSRFYTGSGNIIFSAFDTSHQLGLFTGSALVARMETGERQHFPGKRTYVRDVYPIVDGSSATVTVQIATRDTLQEAIAYGSAISLDAQGYAQADVESRFFRYRINITGGFDHALGALVNGTEAGAW